MSIDIIKGLPRGLGGKESACQAGDFSSISGLGRCPGEGNGNTFLYSYLGSPVDRGAWGAIVDGFSKSGIRLSC